ncbi:hypothetical protein BGZ76_001596 [Entomortierella beljakovae]|nr:hypothetical protein BGZ76_001596 [Entomortierella beljakovae]
MSQVCRLIRDLIDEKLWRDMYIIHLPNWSTGVKVDDLKSTTMWSRMVTRDYLRRTFLWLDRSSVEVRKLPQLDILDEDDSSVTPFWKNHCVETTESITRYIHARNQEANIEAETRLQANISRAKHYHPQHMISAPGQEDLPRWRNVGPPVLYTDPQTHITVASYMQARTCDDRTDHQIAVYELTNHETALAIIPSNYWEHKDADKQLDPELSTANLGPAQLMDMKHFPDPQRPERMRVIFVVAFGERNLGSVDAEDRDLYIVDIWSLLRVVEVSMCSVRHAHAASNSDPFKGRVETIAPRSRQERIRIRMAKIYTEYRNGRLEDRIALFGIHQGARLRTVLMTSPLLAAAPQAPLPNMKGLNPSNVVPSTWECHVLGGKNALKPSCMTLFPAQSEFGHLLVVMDDRGSGEIWNWQRRVRVAVLNLKEPGATEDGESRSNHRSNLYYWGVHVNWAIEEPVINDGNSIPLSLGSSRRSRGDFRVVALADGENTEWESCYWHIDEMDLRKFSEVVYEPEAAPWTIESTSCHFEQSTYGVICTENSVLENSSTLPEETTQPMDIDPSASIQALTFIAYLIWDHYRIAITSQYGITIFDMDKEKSEDILSLSSNCSSQDKRQPQRVTMIKGGDVDPLIDIATVGSYLFITRKYSHMVWEF